MVIRALKQKKVDIGVRDFDLFIECCMTRYRYEHVGATSEQWLQLASDYQVAKGDKESIMANYCMRKAGLEL